jgi:hypothetical protein
VPQLLPAQPGIVIEESGLMASGVGNTAAAAKHNWPYDTEWLPRYGEVQHFEDVPEHIAKAASEAPYVIRLAHTGA